RLLAAGEYLPACGEPLGTLVRFSQSGQRDPGLRISLAGGDSEIRSLALQADGRLLIGGEFTSVNGIRREQIARLFIEPVPVLSYVDGEARYLIPSVPGRQYALQALPDLAGPWLEVDSATGDGSILTLREAIPPDSRRRYLRVEITRPDLR
ncbi:MAG: delta-60 repeat domain-containing protein, partial [Verrucomicrobiales bacterium]